MDGPRIEPLSPARHAGRYWRRFADYGFARGLRRVPLALVEVEPVAAAMPVLFAGGPQGLEPVALLRLVPGGPSRFVSPQGLWLATYVPSILRVHPFAAEPAGDGRMMLAVDESSGLVTDDPRDEPFFGPEGQLSPATASVVEFFRQREGAAGRARAAVARLAEFGLLCPFAPDLPQGVTAPPGAWTGLWAANRARCAALDDARHLELRRLGALELLQAHLVSLAQVPWLLRAEALRDEEASAPRRPAPVAGAVAPPEASEEVRDFLAALAAAEGGDASAHLAAPAAPLAGARAAAPAR
jgi:hypothetical protein